MLYSKLDEKRPTCKIPGMVREKKMQPFNLFESLKEYGENDIEILLHSVLEMRRILLEITNGYDIMLKVGYTL